MNTWKTAATVAALIGAAGIGAALAPAAQGQSSSRGVTAPRAFELFTGGVQIGVSVRDIEDADAKLTKGQTGIVVEEVIEDGPAAKAGIKKGDVIIEFDGERVRSVRQFQRMVRETPEGRNVQTALLRDGQRTTVSVLPAERDGFRLYGDSGRIVAEDFPTRVIPRPAPRAPNPPTPPTPPALRDFESFVWMSGNTLGVTTTDLSDQLGDYFGTRTGVLVTTVNPDSAADKAGVKAGDVITSFNGSTVDSPSELRRSLQRMETGQEFTIGVMREKKALTLKGKLEPRRDTRRTLRTVI